MYLNRAIFRSLQFRQKLFAAAATTLCCARGRYLSESYLVILCSACERHCVRVVVCIISLECPRPFRCPLPRSAKTATFMLSHNANVLNRILHGLFWRTSRTDTDFCVCVGCASACAARLCGIKDVFVISFRRMVAGMVNCVFLHGSSHL